MDVITHDARVARDMYTFHFIRLNIVRYPWRFRRFLPDPWPATWRSCECNKRNRPQSSQRLALGSKKVVLLRGTWKMLCWNHERFLGWWNIRFHIHSYTIYWNVYVYCIYDHRLFALCLNILHICYINYSTYIEFPKWMTWANIFKKRHYRGKICRVVRSWEVSGIWKSFVATWWQSTKDITRKMIQKIGYTPVNKHSTIEDVFPILKMGIFQPAILVYQRVEVSCIFVVQRFFFGGLKVEY